MWPLVASVAVPAVSSAFGQHMANRQNVKLSREGMAFEADQVAKQMQFQERMSGSAYQRATADMRLAGINPMLAYAQGGASTPGGGAASGAAATVQDVVGPAVASAQGARRLKEELQLMQAERHRTYQSANLDYERQLTEQDQRAHLAQQNDLLRAQADLARADLPARRVVGEVGGGMFGRATEYLRRGTGALAPAAGAALGIFGGRVLGRLNRGRLSSSSTTGTYIPPGPRPPRNPGTDLYDTWRTTYTRGGN